MHHLAGVAWVGLADADQHEVVEHPLEGHMDVDDLGEGLPHGGQEDALDGAAHPGVLHGRAPDHRGVVDGVAPVREAADAEDGVLPGQRVEAGVVAEGPLGSRFAAADGPLEDDLGRSRHLQVHRAAVDHLHRGVAQEAGGHHLVHALGQRERGGEGHRRVGADGHGHLHLLSLPVAVVGGPVLVGLPVHAGGPAVVDLQAVHAAVGLAGARVAREDQRQRDEGPAVPRPALQHRETVDGKALRLHHLLAGALADGFGEDPREIGQLGQHPDLVEERAGAFGFQERVQAPGHGVQGLGAQGQAHPPLRTERVDQDGDALAVHVLEEEGRPAGLHDPVRDFGDLQFGADRGLDPDQFAGLLQAADEVAQIGKGHGRSPRGEVGAFPGAGAHCTPDRLFPANRVEDGFLPIHTKYLAVNCINIQFTHDCQAKISS